MSKEVVLLHKDLWLPSWAHLAVKNVLEKYTSYVLSKHVKDRAIKDKDRSHGYTLEKLEASIKNALGKSFEPFEVELTNHGGKKWMWIVTKVCIRIPYDDKDEVCLSIRAYQDKVNHHVDATKAFIVTAWLNAINDEHCTLDTNNYVDKDEFFKINSKTLKN